MKRVAIVMHGNPRNPAHRLNQMTHQMTQMIKFLDWDMGLNEVVINSVALTWHLDFFMQHDGGIHTNDG